MDCLYFLSSLSRVIINDEFFYGLFFFYPIYFTLFKGFTIIVKIFMYF